MFAAFYQASVAHRTLHRLRTAEVPLDLKKALDRSPKAAAFFATLTGANRYAILYRIGAVKKPDTRARKIATYIAMLERGETIHG